MKEARPVTLEGHGVRTMPASFDYLTRLVTWFNLHMPSR